MQLRFEMSGGYAGAFAAHPLTSVVTVDELPEAEREQLRHLVDSSGLLQTAPRDAGPTGHGGGMSYQLAITTEGETRRFTFDDTTVPPAARPLLQALQQRAIVERAGKR